MLSEINIFLNYNNNNNNTNNSNNNNNNKIVHFIIFKILPLWDVLTYTSPLINIIVLLPKFLLKVCYFL